MRSRSLLHVAGPVGAGKTTFIERLLEAEVAFAICIRGERESKLRKEQESNPRSHAELRRYRKAGAAAVALYRFGVQDTDAFFVGSVMQNYSEAAIIEGDYPLELVDLSVFVAPPAQYGGSLLQRGFRDTAAVHQLKIEWLEGALASPETMARFLSEGLSEPFAAMVLASPRVFESMRDALESDLDALRELEPPAPTEQWTIAPGYTGIERAQLIVVNARSEADRHASATLIEDVARLRKDPVVFRDVLGARGSRTPVTAVVADLSNAKDAGLKKAMARVKRSLRAAG